MGGLHESGVTLSEAPLEQGRLWNLLLEALVRRIPDVIVYRLPEPFKLPYIPK